ncbi:TetR/AcrR family transcriptional regulator [Vibrio japonicus]|uniref:TetR/AcrR family transcriptional regulator n=1 Tax=Vibrio japonicus TaxID=1824638 RepID=A0ABY5LN01_9VIBR|nr:TetR/AcrR family transcriptional regulator [Vibrio japonicus]UUM32487.1 TetR/AcrR family transcriptional regulator [Vibrio japonicus]
MESALAILKASGVEGLTMRKVASTAGKSLNNVQHHFKNKDTLLNYLADFYFAQCYEGVEQYAPSKDVSDPKQVLYEFVLFILGESEHISDACLVLRELWAVSTRNKELEDKLNQFYASSVDRACVLWEGYGRANAEKAASLLLPYIEGYSIQHKALPIDREKIAELLSETLYALLTQPVNDES